MRLGFGIPGLRISTSGIRVGPRFANVGVGRGGVRASVGPRIARVSVGTRGVAVGSGIGPLHISSRGVGLSVGSSLGGIGINNRGINGFVGPGPFWLGGAIGSSGPSRGSADRHDTNGELRPKTALVKSRSVFLADMPDLGAQYKSYRDELTAAGVKRRNRFEVRIAAAQALFWASAGMVSVQRPYRAVEPPQLPDLPGTRHIRREARSRLRQRGELTFFMKGKKLLVDDESVVVLEELQKKRQQVLKDLNGVMTKFRNSDPKTANVVYNTILADNMFPARWLGAVDGTGVVMVAFGSMSEMVWPEEHGLTKSGNLAVNKVVKRDMVDLHKSLLLRCLLGTGKEVLSANPKLKSVRVMAVDAKGSKLLKDRAVWAELIVKQADLKYLDAPMSHIQRIVNLEQQWLSADGEVPDEAEWSFFTSLLESYRDLLVTDLDIRRRFGDRMKGHMKKTTGEAVPMGSVSDVLSSEPAVLKLVSSSSQIFVGDFRGEVSVNDLQFWFDLISVLPRNEK